MIWTKHFYTFPWNAIFSIAIIFIKTNKFSQCHLSRFLWNTLLATFFATSNKLHSFSNDHRHIRHRRLKIITWCRWFWNIFKKIHKDWKSDKKVILNMPLGAGQWTSGQYGHLGKDECILNNIHHWKMITKNKI